MFGLNSLLCLSIPTELQPLNRFIIFYCIHWSRVSSISVSLLFSLSFSLPPPQSSRLYPNHLFFPLSLFFSSTKRSSPLRVAFFIFFFFYLVAFPYYSKVFGINFRHSPLALHFHKASINAFCSFVCNSQAFFSSLSSLFLSLAYPHSSNSLFFFFL